MGDANVCSQRPHRWARNTLATGWGLGQNIPVSHSTNQRAFRDCDAQEPFFRLYTLLVAIELALKNACPLFGHGHDLTKLVVTAVATPSSGLYAQLTTLQRALGALICTSRGVRCSVNAAAYPDIRYIRHEKDGFTGDTSEAHLQQALRDAEQLVAELRRAGIAV